MEINDTPVVEVQETKPTGSSLFEQDPLYIQGYRDALHDYTMNVYHLGNNAMEVVEQLNAVLEPATDTK